MYVKDSLPVGCSCRSCTAKYDAVLNRRLLAAVVERAASDAVQSSEVQKRKDSGKYPCIVCRQHWGSNNIDRHMPCTSRTWEGSVSTNVFLIT